MTRCWSSLSSLCSRMLQQGVRVVEPLVPRVCVSAAGTREGRICDSAAAAVSPVSIGMETSPSSLSRLKTRQPFTRSLSFLLPAACCRCCSPRSCSETNKNQRVHESSCVREENFATAPSLPHLATHSLTESLSPHLVFAVIVIVVVHDCRKKRRKMNNCPAAMVISRCMCSCD